MNVGHILDIKQQALVALDLDASVLDVAKMLGERRIGALPVIDRGQLVGIISERDIVRGLAIRGGGVLAENIEALMTKAVFTCSREDTVQFVMAMMTERRIRHVPVMEAGKIVGMISIGDVVKVRVEETEKEAEALKEYIATA